MKKSSGRVGETEAHREEVTHPTSPSDQVSDPLSLLSLSGVFSPLCVFLNVSLFPVWGVSAHVCLSLPQLGSVPDSLSLPVSLCLSLFYRVTSLRAVPCPPSPPPPKAKPKFLNTAPESDPR